MGAARPGPGTVAGMSTAASFADEVTAPLLAALSGAGRVPARVPLDAVVAAARSVLGDPDVPLTAAGVSAETLVVAVAHGYSVVEHDGVTCSPETVLAAVDPAAWDAAFRLRLLQLTDEFCETHRDPDAATMIPELRYRAHLVATGVDPDANGALLVFLLAPTFYQAALDAAAE